MFDFPETVKAIDEVPQEFQGLYEEKDGVIALIPGLRKFYAERTTLNETVQKERKRTQNAERELGGWKAIAESPEALKTKLAEQEGIWTKEKSDLQKLIDEKGDATKQFDKWKSDFEIASTAKVKAAEDKVGTMRGSLERYLVESAAKSAIAEAKGNVKLLLPHVRANCRVVEENGDYLVRVVDSDGEPMSDGKGGYLDIGGFVQQMKKSDDFASAFEAEEKGGSGSEGGQQRPPRGAVKSYSLSEWQTKISSAKPEERKQLLQDKMAGKIRVAS